VVFATGLTITSPPRAGSFFACVLVSTRGADCHLHFPETGQNGRHGDLPPAALPIIPREAQELAG